MRCVLTLATTVVLMTWSCAIGLAADELPVLKNEIGDLPSVEVGMSAPLIVGDANGPLVVCAERGKSESGETGVRVVCVDSVEKKVVLDTFLKLFVSGGVHFALDNGVLYVASNSEKTLKSYDARSLTEIASTTFARKVSKLGVVPGKLVYSENGETLVSAKDLKPLRDWGPRSRKSTPMPVYRREEGWIIDGILYDAELTPQLLLAFPHRSDFKMANNPNWRLWGIKPPPATRGYQTVSFRVSSDSPFSVAMIVQVTNGSAADFYGKVIAFDVQGLGFAELDLKLSSFTKTRIDHELFHDGKQSDSPISVAIAGAKVLVAKGDRLHFWDLTEDRVAKLTRPTRIKRKQSTFTVPADSMVTLKHEIDGGENLASLTESVG